MFQVKQGQPPVAACANVRDRSAGGPAPGVDLCSPVDEPARQIDRLRRVALRHRGWVKLGRGLVAEKLRKLPGCLPSLVAGPVEEIDSFVVLASRTLAE